MSQRNPVSAFYFCTISLLLYQLTSAYDPHEFWYILNVLIARERDVAPVISMLPCFTVKIVYSKSARARVDNHLEFNFKSSHATISVLSGVMMLDALRRQL